LFNRTSWSVALSLFAVTGCPQMKDDDFGRRAATRSEPDASVTFAGDGGSAGAHTAPPDAAEGGMAGSGDSVVDAGSGCERDAVRGPGDICYFADPSLSTWADARASCQRRGPGWDLAAPRNATANDFILGLTGYEAWIGGTDVAQEGAWIWVPDGASFFTVGADAGAEFTAWSSGEPNDYEDSDCLRVLTTGDWADWACADPAFGHVCQRAP
jgi:hypothetical protein